MANLFLFVGKQRIAAHLGVYGQMSKEEHLSPLVNFTWKNRSETGLWLGRSRR